LAKAFGARGAIPGLMISHADVKIVGTLISAGALDAQAAYLAGHIERLGRAGADFAAISAVAPHICAPQLKASIALPFVDPIDCVRAELISRGSRRVSVLGTRFVMRSDMYGRLDGFEVIRPAHEVLDFVDANYVKIVNFGTIAGSGADIEGVRAIAQNLVCEEGADTVILAGTEFSLAFSEADCGFPALDCARTHLDAIVARAFRDMPGS
jgi:aspartate racemase